jgi:NarL family two-component system response regulator LiaR
MKNIRVLIADDHPIVREGLRLLLAGERGMELAGEAVNGNELVVKARDLKPDVILTDLIMPEKDGLQAIREIHKDSPSAKIIVLTSFAEDDRILAALKAGATGYLLKDSLPEELLAAIRDVYAGKPSLSSPIASKLLHELSAPQEEMDSDELTEREMEVLKLVAKGLSNQEIAQQVGLSEWTVRARVSAILEKLRLSNRTQAALYAIKKGWSEV